MLTHTGRVYVYAKSFARGAVLADGAQCVDSRTGVEGQF